MYWANDAYFGFGVGAARYIDGVRSVNTRDLNAYLRRIEAGTPATGPTEDSDSCRSRARETAVLMLRRTRDGIGVTISSSEPASISMGWRVTRSRGLRSRGLLDDDGRRVCLTPSRGSSSPTRSCASFSRIFVKNHAQPRRS